MDYVSVILNIALLVIGTTATLSAFGGETWEKEQKPIVERITKRGWVSLLCLAFALVLGVVKEVHTNKVESDSTRRANEREQDLQKRLGFLDNQLSSALTALVEQKNVMVLSALAVGGKVAELDVHIPIKLDRADTGILEAMFPEWQTRGLQGQSDKVLSIELAAERSVDKSLRAWIDFTRNRPFRPGSSGYISDIDYHEAADIHGSVGLINDTDAPKVEFAFYFHRQLLLRDWMKVLMRRTRIVMVQLLLRPDLSSSDLKDQANSLDRIFSRSAWIVVPLEDQPGMFEEYKVSRTDAPEISNGNFANPPGGPGQVVVSGPLPVVISIVYSVASEPSFHSRLIEDMSTRRYIYDSR
jgi:hypothetical protein